MSASISLLEETPFCGLQQAIHGKLRSGVAIIPQDRNEMSMWLLLIPNPTDSSKFWLFCTGNQEWPEYGWRT